MWTQGAGTAFSIAALLSGSALGQTVTGSIDDAADYFRYPGDPVPTGKGIVYRVQILDANPTIAFAESLPFRDEIIFLRTSSDLTRPLPAEAHVEYLQSIGNIGGTAGTLDFASYIGMFGISVSIGDEVVIVFECADLCDPGDMFSFELTGVAMLAPGARSAERLASLIAASGGAARLVVLDAQGVARDMGQVSLATRDGQISVTGIAASGGDDMVLSSKAATQGLAGNLYTWAQITGFDSTADTGPASTNGTGIQIGADVAVGTDLVAGLSLGYSDINATDGSTSQDGSMTYLQPYIAYRSGRWHGNASLIFGQGDYDQKSVGGDGTGETGLFAVTFAGGYDVALQNGLAVTPMLGLIQGHEDVTGTGGTLAGAGTDRYDFSQASLGARLTSRIAEGTVFAGLHADYLDQDAGTVLTSEFLSETGWSGRIELGGSTDMNGGFGLSTSVDISGLGGSAQTLAGGLRLALRF